MRQNRPTQPDSTGAAIIEAAFRLFNRNPGAPFAEVATEAGIGRATLYRHYPTREALLAEVTRTALAELDQAVEAATHDAPTYTEGLRRAFVAMIPLADRQWFLTHQDGLDTPQMEARADRDRQETTDAFAHAQAEGAFDPALPPDHLAEAFDALLYTAWTLVRDGRATPTQAADFGWRLLTTGAKRNDS